MTPPNNALGEQAQAAITEALMRLGVEYDAILTEATDWQAGQEGLL